VEENGGRARAGVEDEIIASSQIVILDSGSYVFCNTYRWLYIFPLHNIYSCESFEELGTTNYSRGTNELDLYGTVCIVVVAYWAAEQSAIAN
jgi:hypothetical protein